MIKEKLRLAAPYSGILVLGLALPLWRAGRLEAFDMLQKELLIIFGYLAALGDLKAKKIPNRLVLAMLAGWLLILTPQVFLHTQAALGYIKNACWGCVLGGGLFLLIYLLSRHGLGGGDVKFMAAAGLYLGFNGTLPAMLYGTVLAGLAALALLLFKRLGRKDTLPLAPFLYAGILLTVFFL